LGKLTLIADTRERLDRFLVRSLPEYSRTRLSKLVDEGLVLVEGKPATKSGLALEIGWVIELDEPAEAAAHDLTPAEIPLDVVWEDEHFLIVNKPRGLATHPAPSLREPSLVNALLARGDALSTAGGEFRPGIVHRLDKETTGLLLVAKSDRVHVALAKQIEAKTARREYLAIVHGEVLRPKFRVDSPIGRDPKLRQRMAIEPRGKPAITDVEVIRRVPAGTLLRCQLQTGRTHQIRVHLTSIGHPVLGDRVYAPKSLQDAPLQLHAWRLTVLHPITGETIEAEAAPPDDFLAQP
jgi:23S rRNA pseudouridine1911/1915/1917 synthase